MPWLLFSFAGSIVCLLCTCKYHGQRANSQHSPSSPILPPPLPPPPLLPQHYSVVDASEGQIFIAVYHTFNNTNLYLSEEAGLSYALSLEFIVSPPESDWEGGYPTFDVHVVS